MFADLRYRTCLLFLFPTDGPDLKATRTSIRFQKILYETQLGCGLAWMRFGEVAPRAIARTTQPAVRAKEGVTLEGNGGRQANLMVWTGRGVGVDDGEGVSTFDATMSPKHTVCTSASSAHAAIRGGAFCRSLSVSHIA